MEDVIQSVVVYLLIQHRTNFEITFRTIQFDHPKQPTPTHIAANIYFTLFYVDQHFRIYTVNVENIHITKINQIFLHFALGSPAWSYFTIC